MCFIKYISVFIKSSKKRKKRKTHFSINFKKEVTARPRDKPRAKQTAIIIINWQKSSVVYAEAKQHTVTSIKFSLSLSLPLRYTIQLFQLPLLLLQDLSLSLSQCFVWRFTLSLSRSVDTYIQSVSLGGVVFVYGFTLKIFNRISWIYIHYNPTHPHCLLLSPRVSHSFSSLSSVKTKQKKL